tara:strand:- start:59 stop:268 length:210 start_codon:yes stop_codon:yes gene_type:complete
MSKVLLRIRSSLAEPFIANHHLGGWKVRDADNKLWIDMHLGNTKVYNPDFNDKLPESESNPRWLDTRGL